MSSKANIAVTATRGCIGVWDYMTGALRYTLAKVMLSFHWSILYKYPTLIGQFSEYSTLIGQNEMGAIVTQAIVNEEGDTVIAAESGEILFWNLETKSVVYSDEARGVVQIKLNKKQTKLLIVQSSGPIGNHKG